MFDGLLGLLIELLFTFKSWYLITFRTANTENRIFLKTSHDVTNKCSIIRILVLIS